MSMLDEHALALSQIDEGFHNFLLLYKRADKKVYGFVEGKDDVIFYTSMIERFLPEDWEIELLVAGSKRKALKTYRSFDWSRFNPNRIAFFLDRDTDEYVCSFHLKEHNIYYTDGYSIENSFVNRGVFLRLLSEAYSVIDIDQNEKEEILREFDENLASFKGQLLPIMAQIVVWRMLGQPANLNNCDISKFFCFRDGCICRQPAYEDDDDFAVKYSDSIGANLGDVGSRKRIEAVLNNIDPERNIVRGKFLLWFLAHYVNYVHGTIHSRVQSYDRPPRIRQGVTPKTVGFAAAPRARIPTSLRAFIAATYSRFVDEGLTLVA